MSKRPQEIGQTLKCASCLNVTTHNVLREVSILAPEPDTYWWRETTRLVQCETCDAVGMAQRTVTEDHDGESFDGQEFEGWVRTPCAPRRLCTFVDRELPRLVQQAYNATVAAVNQENHLLAAVGLRMIIESVCANKRIPGKNLEAKIDGMVGKEVLTAGQARILHKHRFLGNTAAHEIRAPGVSDIDTALDIIDTILKSIYALPIQARRVRVRKRTRKAGAGQQAGIANSHQGDRASR